MSYRVAFKLVSLNEKTGPIPVSATEESTCPPTCGQFKECYGKLGHLAIHWNAINEGTRGMLWSDFCDAIKRLPHIQLWRHNQVGDLPGDGVTIDGDALRMLVRANKGKRGFTYTHYPLTKHNIDLIKWATEEGFTINYSIDSISQVDNVVKLVTPAVVVLPSVTNVHSLYTLGGTKIVVCPATYRDDMNCMRCRICADSRPERAVVGFPAHGSRKKQIDLKLVRS
jgi:hypothetical protein